MPAADGQILTLRPVGFTVDPEAIDSYIKRIPGTYRPIDERPWTIVVPPSDLRQMIRDPEAKTPHIPGLQCVLVSVDDEKIWIHPGYNTSTWGCAQRVVKWLLGFGPWSVCGRAMESEQELDHGTIKFEGELFTQTYYDPNAPFQIPDDLTSSPPVVGTLTSLTRNNEYGHTLMRVHDSGAFWCEITSEVDEMRWDGRLVDEFIDQWTSMLSALDFAEKSSTLNEKDSDVVGIFVEEATQGGSYRAVNVRDPQPSFAGIVRLLVGWIEDLLDDKLPSELTKMRLTFPESKVDTGDLTTFIDAAHFRR